VPPNIALKLPYLKIEKTVLQFLTADEYNRLILPARALHADRHFSRQTQDIWETMGSRKTIENNGSFLIIYNSISPVEPLQSACLTFSNSPFDRCQ
jgi:hypothetical protein